MVVAVHLEGFRSPMSRFDFLRSDLPLAFAHRGGALEAPENTMAAFGHAVDLGYRYIETDIQATRDGVAVVFHDDDLIRLTGRPEAVADLSWDDLKHVRVAGEPIPRLDELLAAWPDLRVNLEPKSDLAVEPMAQAIRAAGAREARLRRLFSGISGAPAAGAASGRRSVGRPARSAYFAFGRGATVFRWVRRTAGPCKYLPTSAGFPW